MKTINNLKRIREIYGATQEQIAQALSVNRVTVANWENGSTVASSTNREKMSIYYGIGPEFFYNQELTDDAITLIRKTAEKARTIVNQSDGTRSKEEDFQKLFGSVSFSKALKDYMMATKLLLAAADDTPLDKLKLAHDVNKKLGRRLQSMIIVREEEDAEGTPSLADLYADIVE